MNLECPKEPPTNFESRNNITGITHSWAHRSTPRYFLDAVPGAALVRRAEAVAARPDVLAVPVAVAVGGHAHAEAADGHDGLGRADQHEADAVGRDAAGEGHLGAGDGAELALRVGVVVGRLDDVDGEVAVWWKG